MSNTDEKEKQLNPFDDDTQEPLTPEEAAPPVQELSSKATPFFSALSTEPEKTAPPRPAKTWPMPQRKTVFFGEDELAAIDKEIQAVSSPKPPAIPSQRISTIAHLPPASLPTPTPAALNAQLSQKEHMELFSLSKNTALPGADVLGVPSETFLSPEDRGEISDPSSALKTLLHEVFPDDSLDDLDILFQSPSPPSAALPSAPRTSALPPPVKELDATPPHMPPWDPFVPLVSRQTQTQFPPVAPPEAVPPPVLPPPTSGARYAVPEPSVSLFEGLAQTRLDAHSPATQKLSTAPPRLSLDKTVKPPVIPTPATSAPVIPTPVISAPTIPTPATSVPVIPTPVISAPTIPTPATSAPVIPTPVISAPTIPTPVTSAPVIPTPVTSAPVIPTPVTSAPVIPTPVTSVPVISTPVISAPATSVPATSVPVISTPVVSAPVVSAPVTAAPAVAVPEMSAPAKQLSLAEKEAAASIPAAKPIFQVSLRPSFVDPENRPAPVAPIVFHPLEKTHEAIPASLSRLVGAFVVDALLLCTAALGMLWAAKAFTEPSQATAQASSGFGDVAAWQVLGPTGIALLALLAAAYATFFAVFWNGATLGRKLLGLRLVNKEGHSIGFLKALLRSLLSLFSFVPALAGFWWAFIDKRRQTFHDKCTATFVVRIQPKP